MTTAVMLGGPNHGKRYGLPEGADHVCFPVMRQELPAYWLDGITATFETVSCPMIRLPIFHREIAAVLHPQYSRDTGKRMLADLVMRAWSRYDVSSDRTERGK